MRWPTALGAAAVFCCLAAVPAKAAPVDYPHRVVTLVTHSSPGGGSDVFLREMVEAPAPIYQRDVHRRERAGRLRRQGDVPRGHGASRRQRLLRHHADLSTPRC